MKILILVDKYFPISETFIYHRINALHDHSVILLGRKWINRDRIKIPTHVRNQYFYANPFFIIRYKLFKKGILSSDPAIRIVRNAIRKERVDLLIIHYGHNAVQYAPMIRELKIPVMVYFHGIDLSLKLEEKRYKEELIKVLPHINLGITNSQFLGERLLKFGLKNEQLRIIPNGVDVRSIKEIPVNRGKKTIKIIHAGRVVPKKGVPDLVHVTNELLKEGFDITLEIFGDGYGMNEVKVALEKIHYPEKIHLKGECTQQEVFKALRSADIFVLNSQTDSKKETEGLPNTLLEAMAADIAIITTYHGGIPEVITNEKEGLLIPEKDNDALKRSLIRLIEDEKLRKQLGKTAFEKVSKEYSIESLYRNVQHLVGQFSTSW